MRRTGCRTLTIRCRSLPTGPGRGDRIAGDHPPSCSAPPAQACCENARLAAPEQAGVGDGDVFAYRARSRSNILSSFRAGASRRSGSLGTRGPPGRAVSAGSTFIPSVSPQRAIRCIGRASIRIGIINAPLARASAITRLARSPSREAIELAVRALSIDDPLIRLSSIAVLSNADAGTRRKTLAPLLGDATRLVRMEAARALAGEAEGDLQPAERARFEKALKKLCRRPAFQRRTS